MNKLMKYLSVVIIVLLIVCESGSAGDNIFKNESLGFEITKPSGWYFASINQHFENLKKIKLEDPKFQEAMVKYSNIPIVIITKYKEPYDDLNPSIKVNVRPSGPYGGLSGEKILSITLSRIKHVFKEFRIVEKPKEVKVSGHLAGYAKINYSLKASGQSFKVTSKLWIVPKGQYIFMIGAGVREDQKNGSLEEISEIIKNIRIR